MFSFHMDNTRQAAETRDPKREKNGKKKIAFLHLDWIHIHISQENNNVQKLKQ